MSVERNSRTGMAMCTVADILLKFNKTWNNTTFIERGDFKENLRKKGAHCGRHLMDAGSQCHDTDLHFRDKFTLAVLSHLVAFADHQTILKALDKLLLQ